MFATSHILAGAAIGAVSRGHPVRAFGIGLVSHVVMDVAPHWGRPLEPHEFLRIARRDGLLALTALAGAVAVAGNARSAVLTGAIGAVLLDADKPCRHFFGCSCFPPAIDDFHDAIQNEAADRLGLEIGCGIGLAVVAGVLLKRARRAPRRSLL